MGILIDDLEQDTDAVYLVCSESINDWNSRYAEEYGIAVGVNRDTIEIICRVGGNMLEKSFPTAPASPSAFKRVATLLIMMCLHPFPILRRKNADGLFSTPVIPDENIRQFVVQLLIDTLPLTFSLLLSQVDGEWVPLTNWVEFKSKDFNDEFLLFLMWLGNSDCLKHSQGSPVYDDERLTRIILATSLILEASYGPVA